MALNISDEYRISSKVKKVTDDSPALACQCQGHVRELVGAQCALC